MNCCECGEAIVEWSYHCKSCGCELCGACIGAGDLCSECRSHRDGDDPDMDIIDALAELREASGGRWEDVDPDEFVRNERDE